MGKKSSKVVLFQVRLFKDETRRFGDGLTKSEARNFHAAGCHLVAYLEETYGLSRKKGKKR